jgi:hypothetical protein
VIDQIWHSEIIMGSTAMDSIAWAKWPTGTSNPLDMLLDFVLGADLKILGVALGLLFWLGLM